MEKISIIFAGVLTGLYFLLAASVNGMSLLVLVPIAALSFYLFLRNRTVFYSAFFFLLPFLGEFQEILGLRAIPVAPALLFPALVYTCKNWKSLDRIFLLYCASLLLSLIVGFFWSFAGYQSHHSVGALAHQVGWNVLFLIIPLTGFTLYFLLRQDNVSEDELGELFFWLVKGLLVCTGFTLLQYFKIWDISSSHRSLPLLEGRFDGTFIDTNALGFVTAIVISLCFSVFLTKGKRWILFLLPALILPLHLSGSRSGILIFIATGAILFLMLPSWRKKIKFIIMILFSVFFFLLVAQYADKEGRELRSVREAKKVVRQFSAGETLNYSNGLNSFFPSRAEFWSLACKVISDHWLVGVGSGRYLVDARKYKEEVNSGFNDNACNMYLQVAAEQGSIGFLIFLWMLVWILMDFLRNFSQTSLFQRVAFSTLSGVLVSFVFGSHIVNSEANIMFWFLITIVLSKKKPETQE